MNNAYTTPPSTWSPSLPAWHVTTSLATGETIRRKLEAPTANDAAKLTRDWAAVVGAEILTMIVTPA